MVRFSVVVPAYNASPTLAETLDAVLKQSCDDWECVVVDDGSKDNTLDIASAYAAADSRFRPLTQANSGTGGAYNTGVSNARGQFIVLCSADDILLPDCLTELDQAIREAEDSYDIYSTNGYLWTPETDARVLVYEAPAVPESWSLTDLIARCFYSVGAAYRREWHARLGGYRVDVFGEDYDFWLRALASGARHRYLDRPLSLHRVSATQKSANLMRAYSSDIRLVRDLRSSFSLSPDQRRAVSHRIAEARSIIRNIRKEQRLHRLRLLRASDAPILRPLRSLYRRLKRLGR